jgi:hypothetical protein
MKPHEVFATNVCAATSNCEYIRAQAQPTYGGITMQEMQELQAPQAGAPAPAARPGIHFLIADRSAKGREAIQTWVRRYPEFKQPAARWVGSRFEFIAHVREPHATGMTYIAYDLKAAKRTLCEGIAERAHVCGGFGEWLIGLSPEHEAALMRRLEELAGRYDKAA